MKILRIQFENLNSLPVGEIDFTASPLAEAGLFAITGATGAGKSTILDAITLALYGKAARYQNAPNPVDMMSRRAAACHSEVTFEVRGEIYRVRWQLRRARGLASGKMQAPQRYLYDAKGTVLAEKITDVQRLVEELTGLSYDRFLRSALLAQGQFARFLMANEGERAQLLESLTGTEVYAELGQLAYREATDREEELKRRTTALEGTALLSPEEQAEKRAELHRQAEAIAALHQSLSTARAYFERGQQLAGHLQSEITLQSEQAEALRAIADVASEKARLERHQLAAPFLSALQALDHLTAQESSEATTHRTTLEHSIRATREATAAQGALIALYRNEADRQSTALQVLRGERTVRTARLDELAALLIADPAAGTLDAEMPMLQEHLTQLGHLRRAVTRGQAAAGELEGKIAELQGQQKLRQQTCTEANEALRKLAQTFAEISNRASTLRKDRNEEELQAKTRRLEERQAMLGELESLMVRFEEAKKRSGELADEEGKLTAEIEEIRKQIAETEREARDQAHMLKLAEQSHQRLMQMASLDDHRALLKSGEPCPLCGAEEHPAAHRSILSAEIEDALRRVETARSANDTAVKEAVLAREHLTRSDADLGALRKENATLRRQQTDDYDRFTTLARPLRVYTLESLEEKRAEHQKERVDWEAQLVAIRESDQQKAAAELAHAEGKHLADRLAAEQTALATTLEELCARHRASVESLRADEATLAPLLLTLPPLLSAHSLSCPLPGEEAATRALLEKRRQTYRVRSDEAAKLRQQEAEAAGRAEALEKAISEANTCADQLGLTQPEADTQAVTRWVKSWGDVDTGRRGLETLRTEQAVLASRVQEQAERLSILCERVKDSTQRLMEALEPTPFTSLPALREAILAPEEQREITARLDALQSRAQTLTGKLEQLRSQIASLRKQSAPEGDALVQARSASTEAEEAHLAATKQRTTLELELRRHEEQARHHQEAIAAIQQERERLDGWLRLRGMIGGPAFRKFAQGLTLDVLLRHANQHLARLTDRYLLQRAQSGELELEISDLHQAGALRPAASLSGGESFLASLALALGLSDLAGRSIRIDSLFIDEGFGTLDPETLDIALAALDTLRMSQKTIGVISHVDLLKERINVQIVVEKQAGGESRLRLRS